MLNSRKKKTPDQNNNNIPDRVNVIRSTDRRRRSWAPRVHAHFYSWQTARGFLHHHLWSVVVYARISIRLNRLLSFDVRNGDFANFFHTSRRSLIFYGSFLARFSSRNIFLKNNAVFYVTLIFLFFFFIFNRRFTVTFHVQGYCRTD